MDLTPGSNVGPYRLIEQIGMGGMATVYKAYHAAMDRHVALKILPREFAKDPNYLGRFHQEARTIANLEHPHILPVYDFGEDGGLTYLVMRLLEAGTLKDRLLAGPLSIADINRWFSETAEALTYAHNQGVIHRDIKPSNVLVDRHGNAFLTDFGVAKLVEGASQFTASGALIGTPAYMAPEQGKGHPSDERSDLYALGVVLYEMCTGRVPFDAETPLAVVLKHISDPLPLPRDVNPDVPSAVQDVILKALSKDPADRYETATEMLQAWKRAVEGLVHLEQPFGEAPTPQDETRVAEARATASPAAAAGTQVGRTVGPEPAAPRRRRFRWWWAALPAGLLFVCVVVVLVLSEGGQPRQVRPDGGPQSGTPGLVATGAQSVGAAPRPTEAGAPGQTSSTSEGGGEPSAVTYGNANDVRALQVVGAELWAVGGGGVVIWDRAARTLRRLAAPVDLPTNLINSILVEADGVVWLGTEDHGLLRREPDGTLIQYDTADGLDSNLVGPIARDHEGGLLVGTAYGSSGLNRLFDSRWEIIPFPSLPDVEPSDLEHVSNHVTGLYDLVDLLVVATTSGLALSEDGQAWQVIKQEHGLPANLVYTVFFDRQRRAWVGTEAGAAYISDAAERFVALPTLEEQSVLAIHQDASGVIWLGLGWGLARFDEARGDWQFFYPEDGVLAGPAVNAIVEDQAGVLWFGSQGGGITRYADGEFEIWQVPNQPSFSRFGSIIPAPDGDLLITEEYGGPYDRYSPLGDEFRPQPDLPEGASPMAVAADGTLWAGSEYAGLWRVGDAARQYTTADGLPSDAVTAVALDTRGFVWVGTDAGLARFDGDGGEFQVFDSATGALPGDRVIALLVASSGEVWVGTDGGGAVLSGDDWRRLEPGDPLHPDTQAVVDLAEGPDGSLWLATDSGGLAQFDPQADSWTLHYDDLRSDVVLAVAADPRDGSVWIGYYYDGASHLVAGQWVDLGQGTLAHPNVNDIYVDEAGVVYFTTTGGFTRYGP